MSFRVHQLRQDTGDAPHSPLRLHDGNADLHDLPELPHGALGPGVSSESNSSHSSGGGARSVQGLTAKSNTAAGVPTRPGGGPWRIALGWATRQACGARTGDCDGLHKRTLLSMTALYCFTQALIGMVIGGLGAELSWLGRVTRTGINEENEINLVRGVTYMIGSAIGGPLSDRLAGHRLNATALASVFVFSVLIPASDDWVATAAVMSVVGLATGLLDCTTNTLIMWTWGPAVGPYMQCMHLSFAVGAFVMPLISAALLHSGGDSQAPSFYIQGCLALPLVLWSLLTPSPPPRVGNFDPHGGNLSDEGHVTGAESYEETEGDVEMIDFHPNGAVKSPTTSDASSGEKERSHGAMGHVDTEGYSHMGGPYGCCGESKRPLLYYWVVALTAVLLFVGSGTEVGLGTWISTFAQIRFGASEEDGAILTSEFWLGMMCGRAAAVVLAVKFKPATMLAVDYVLAVIGVIAAGASTSIAGAHVGTVIAGCAIASIFPACMSLAPSRQMPMSGTATAIVVTGGSAGELLVPFIMGAVATGGSTGVMLAIPGLLFLLGAVVLFLIVTSVPRTADVCLKMYRLVVH